MNKSCFFTIDHLREFPEVISDLPLSKNTLLHSHFYLFYDSRTRGVLYFRYFEIKEYKMFFFVAILIFENCPCIL